MKILLVAGARPNFVKVASIIDAIDAYNRTGERPLEYRLIHTGQHYDTQMSQAFFRDLGLPQPNVDLGVGSASHAAQTAEIMRRFEPILLRERPDVVLVVGDVNSTIACALVASKVTYASSAHASQPSRPLVAHVEAGLRSFDRTMPEEINRVLTDAISDLLFITEDSARENLLREGVPRRKIHFVGNTMVDTLFKHRQKAQQSNILLRLGLKAPSKDSRRGSKSLRGAAASGPATTCRDYAVVTLHRPSNVDDRKTFREILEALSSIAKVIPIVFPTHPRTLHRIKEFHFEGYFDFVSQTISLRPQSSSIQCLEPLGYVDFLCLMSNAKLVLTDSGGLQEETTVLSIPCITLRQNTERPVTITHGTNVLAGTQKEAIVHCAFRQLIHPPIAKRPKLWDGRAGERIIKVLARQIADHDVCITGSKSPQGHSLRLQPAPDACVNSRCEQSPA